MEDFLKKLKDEYITLVVGILFGIPAMAILLPGLYSTLVESDIIDENYACIFSLFSIAYFTLPFFLLPIALSGQVKDRSFTRLRYGLFLSLVIVNSMIVIFHLLCKEKDNGHFKPGLLFGSIFCFYLLATIALVKWYYRLFARRILFAKIKNASVIFLFIPIHYVVSILTTVFPYDSIDEPVIYKTALFILFVFMYSIPLILLVFFNKKEAKANTPSDRRIRFLEKERKRTFTFLVIVLVAVLSTLVFSYLFTDDKAKSDFCFTKEYNNIRDLDAVNEKLEKINLAITYSGMQKTRDSLKSTYLEPFVKGTGINSSGLDADSAYLLRYNDTLQSCRRFLFKNVVLINKRATTDMTSMVSVTRHKGIFVFLSDLVIMLAFLYVLKREKTTRTPGGKRSVEVNAKEVKNITHGFFILVFVLFVTLVKPIEEGSINPKKPEQLFHMNNWNLLKKDEPEAPAKQQGPKLSELSKDTANAVPGAGHIAGNGADTSGLSLYVTSINKLLGSYQHSCPVELKLPGNKVILDSVNFSKFLMQQSKTIDELSKELVELKKDEDNTLMALAGKLDSMRLKKQQPVKK